MKITTIITSFNSQKYLDAAISSFLDQDYDNKELIIVDGKSTDASHQIIKKYHDINPKLIIWVKDIDSGISNARNLGLKRANGDIIGFLGADDVLHKNFFKELVYYAHINSNFDVMYFDGYGISREASNYRAAAHIPFTKRNLIKHSPIASGECFYYKKHIFNDFSFNEKNKHTMDYEMSMALVSSKKKISFYGVAIPAVFNISDGTNISNALSLKQRAETVAVQLKYTNCLLGRLKIILRRPKFYLKNFGIIYVSIKNLS